MLKIQNRTSPPICISISSLYHHLQAASAPFISPTAGSKCTSLYHQQQAANEQVYTTNCMQQLHQFVPPTTGRKYTVCATNSRQQVQQKASLTPATTLMNSVMRDDTSSTALQTQLLAARQKCRQHCAPTHQASKPDISTCIRLSCQEIATPEPDFLVLC